MIELLAAVGLTLLVVTVAVTYYREISHQSTEVTQRVREERRAASLLDRVARDLEGTVLLVKPDEVDPLAFPWVFFAESRLATNGADRLLFVSRRWVQRASDVPESDLDRVAYSLVKAEDGSFTLLRWSEPGLPASLERDIPAPDAPDNLVLARGLASFAVRFLDESGQWKSEWDSSQVVDSSKLPLAAEIQVAMAPPPEARPGTPPSGPYLRRVWLPLRPLDMAVLTGEKPASGGTGDQAGNGQCVTVAQCLARNPGLLQGSGVSEAVIQSIANQCFSNYAASFPGVQGCQ
jgi:hypothetical protein